MNENYILALLNEAEVKARIAEIEQGKRYTFSQLKTLVFGDKGYK